MEEGKVEYLGDGAYIKFTGYSVIFMANSHSTPTDEVSIEAADLGDLISILQECKNTYEQSN